MLNTLWFNLKKPDGQAPEVLQIAEAGGTGLLHQIVPVATIYNRGELAGIEIELVANAVAPGASKTVTVYYAFSSYDNRNITELSPLAASQVLDVANVASARRSYVLPILYQGAAYLHIWFDATGLAAGSTLNIELRVNAKTAN